MYNQVNCRDNLGRDWETVLRYTDVFTFWNKILCSWYFKLINFPGIFLFVLFMWLKILLTIATNYKDRQTDVK